MTPDERRDVERAVQDVIAAGLPRVPARLRDVVAGDVLDAVVAVLAGPVRDALEVELAGMPDDVSSSALAQLALSLASVMDSGAGLAVAAVARELRATITALRKEDDDDDDALTIGARMSSPVGHGT